MRIRIAIVPSLILALSAVAADQREDAVARALKDEMNRSMKQLQLERLDKPYFIAYRVTEISGRAVTAHFGALVNSAESRARTLQVEVRVGDYKLDNTNFLSPSLRGFSAGAALPLEDDYKEIRRQVWLATDAAYKRALEDLARKRAALQNKTRTDDTPDFSQEPAASVDDEGVPAAVDPARMERLARRLSALYREMPDVHQGAVMVNVFNQRTWYHDSEGRLSKRFRPLAAFAANAVSQAPDGAPLARTISAHARSLDGLPAEEELVRRVREMGASVRDLRAAPTLESYNGPVLFEGDAAPEIFERVFVPNLLATRRPVAEGTRSVGRESPFLDKLGARVLPEFLSAADRPALDGIAGQPLLGGMNVDDQGVPVQETALVEKGVLKTLLTTRTPVRRIERSNGHARGGGPAPTNLVVTAENGLRPAELRAKFLDMLKAQDKEFGVIVRSVGGAVQAAGAAEPALSLVLAYKVFPDGREELVRGVEVSGLSASTFKEILAASQDPAVVTGAFRGGVMPGGHGFPTDRTVSFAVPALLFEDVTIKKISRELPKPPVAPHPYFDR